MTLHARAQLRGLVVGLLAGFTLEAVPAYVFPVVAGRNYPFHPDELPALAVYTRAEARTEGGSMGLHGPVSSRALTATVAGVIRTDDSDDTADAIALEVERRMAAACLPGGVFAGLHDLVLDRTTITAAIDNDKSMRVIELSFVLEYRTPDGDPSRLI